MIQDQQPFTNHYLNCLRPFANDKAILLTAPAELLSELSEMARRKHTNRLDLIRFALSKFIDDASGGSSS